MNKIKNIKLNKKFNEFFKEEVLKTGLKKLL